MAQEDNNKMKPNFPGRNNDERGQKKPPRFNIYWIYALIAILFIGLPVHEHYHTGFVKYIFPGV